MYKKIDFFCQFETSCTRNVLLCVFALLPKDFFVGDWLDAKNCFWMGMGAFFVCGRIRMLVWWGREEEGKTKDGMKKEEAEWFAPSLPIEYLFCLLFVCGFASLF